MTRRRQGCQVSKAAFLARYFGGNSAPVAKRQRKPSTGQPKAANKKGRKGRNQDDVKSLASSADINVELEVSRSGRQRRAPKSGDGTELGWQGVS